MPRSPIGNPGTGGIRRDPAEPQALLDARGARLRGRLARAVADGDLPADQPRPADRRARRRPVRRLDLRQQGDAPGAPDLPTRPPLRLRRHNARDRLRPGEPETMARRPRAVGRRRPDPDRARHLDRAQAGPEGLLPEGPRPIPGIADVARDRAEPRPIPLRHDRTRHTLPLRPARTPRDDRRPGLLARLPVGRHPDPALAADLPGGDRDAPGTSARPIGAAAGIPRPPRLPARRQPAMDPLADQRPARPADGQGVRAAVRAGRRRAARPLAPPDQARRHPPRGGRGRDPVLRHGLPGDVQGAGPSPPFGMDRRHPGGSVTGRPRSACSTKSSNLWPCSARPPKGTSAACSMSSPRRCSATPCS